MQRASIVPDDHVGRLLPLDAGGVFLLRDVREQPLDQRVRLVLGQAFDVVRVRRDVDVAPTAGLVHLDQAVAGHHAAVGRVEVLEKLGRPELARLRDRVVHDVVLLEQLPLEIRIQIIPCCAGVCKVRVASVPWRWDLHGPQE